MITIAIPIRLDSNANMREHHMAKARRMKTQRHTVAMFCRMPLHGLLERGRARITIVRVAPRCLDIDNAWSSAKAVIDGVADALGLKNDRDRRIDWAVRQEKGAPKQYGLRIECETLGGGS
jgi:hypothetical protein